MAKKQAEREDLGASEVQERFDEIEAAGLVGEEVDPTPNENYTVEGVTSGAPTPETDAELREKALASAGFRPRR